MISGKPILIYLNDNEKTINDDKIYKCKFCGKNFKQNINFKNHIKIHNKTKNLFYCSNSECYKVFHTKMNLNIHKELIHKYINDKNITIQNMINTLIFKNFNPIIIDNNYKYINNK